MRPPTFPVRPSRAAFGPRYRNESDVVDDETEADAEVFDSVCFQVAGAGGAAPLAWVCFSTAGDVLAAWEAWDPDSNFVPEVERTATGIYLVTYPALVPDAQGTDLALVLVGAIATPQATVARWACPAVQSNGHIVDVRTYALDGTTATNLKTLLAVW